MTTVTAIPICWRQSRDVMFTFVCRRHRQPVACRLTDCSLLLH